MLENNLAVTVKHENWYMMCLGRYGASLEAELLDEVSDDVSKKICTISQQKNTRNFKFTLFGFKDTAMRFISFKN
jgi:hypothetical protein